MTKVMSGAVMLAAMILTTAAPALAAAPICLAARDIKETDAQKDGRSILYTMRDGSVWRNDLRGVCKDARWNGFGYSTANSQSSICEICLLRFVYPPASTTVIFTPCRLASSVTP